ncbi:MAG: hypothetical protein ACPGYX_04895 [Oceanobacter sp.]
MNANISELSRLYLWSLLLSGGRGYVAADDIQLPEEISERLERAGLIQRADVSGTVSFSVTDTGHNWLFGQMLEATQPGSPLAAEVLNKLMNCLHKRLRLDSMNLQQWLHVPTSEGSSEWLDEINLDLAFDDEEPDDSQAVPQRLRQAYLDLSGQRFNMPVRIAELRKKLADVSHSELDSALMLLELEGQVWFATTEDPHERHVDDEHALLHVSGISRDLVYLEK